MSAMNPVDYIVLSAGKPDPSNMPMGLYSSLAMMPVNGKPVIGWVLDQFCGKPGVGKVVVVAREDDHRLHEFIRRYLDGRVDYKVVFPPSGPGAEEGILVSLRSGLSPLSLDHPVRVVLGDTLLLDEMPADKNDFVVGSGAVNDSKEWCLVEVDSSGRVADFFDKQQVSLESRNALVGYYAFSDPGFLLQSTHTAIARGMGQLSDVLKLYLRQNSLEFVPTANWFDFGHMDRIVEARFRLLNTRFFNSLNVDVIRGVVEKKSTKKEKLSDEAYWYEGLPEVLRIFSPRLLSHGDRGDHYFIEQEFYGYPTLAELYLYSEMGPMAWKSVLKKLLAVHQVMRTHEGSLPTACFDDLYRAKTWERLSALAAQDAYWSELLSRGRVVVNGTALQGLPHLKDQIEERIAGLLATVRTTVVHGDYCFSNILFDPATQIVRLIDPRGRFGERGVWGDPRYDIAKLRHSVCGLYDFVNAGLYSVSEKNGEFSCRVFARPGFDDVKSFFDEQVVKSGYDLKDIQFIEALLFLTMVPLHADYPGKQKMFFLYGLQLMNQVLGQESGKAE